MFSRNSMDVYYFGKEEEEEEDKGAGRYLRAAASH